MFARAVLLAAVMLLLGANAWAARRCVAIDGATLQCGSERVIEGLNTLAVDELARQRLQRRIQSGEVVISAAARSLRPHPRAAVRERQSNHAGRSRPGFPEDRRRLGTAAKLLGYFPVSSAQ